MIMAGCPWTCGVRLRGRPRSEAPPTSAAVPPSVVIGRAPATVVGELAGEPRLCRKTRPTTASQATPEETAFFTRGLGGGAG